MHARLLAASFAAALLVTAAAAQITAQTKVAHDTSMKNGVATSKTTVTHVYKHKTRHPRKILGVKVGHRTAVSKTVKTTTTSSDGDTSTTVKTSH